MPGSPPPAEDDIRWWSFGDGTLAALKTFQVSMRPSTPRCAGAMAMHPGSAARPCKGGPAAAALCQPTRNHEPAACPRSNSLPPPQACSGYPESGVCDGATWRLLLGEDAQPSDLARLKSGESDDDDLAAEVGGSSCAGGWVGKS